MSYKPYSPDKIFILKSAENYPATSTILSNASNVSTQIIDDISEADKNTNKKILILAKQKGKFYKPCPGTQNYICCGYKILNLVNNCEINCSYCVLQGYFDSNHITVYVNIEDLFKELSDLLERHPEHNFRIGTGELADSLSTDHITRYSTQLISFFARYRNALLELKTKTTQIENFIKEMHNGRTVVSWSLNTPHAIAAEEQDAPALEDRLQAARDCQNAGFKIGFHFDPMIYYPDWERDYKITVDKIFDYINPENITWISLGALRYPPHLDGIIRERHPESNIVYGELFPGIDGKSRYFKQIRIDMFKNMHSWIKSQNDNIFVYLCMESPEIWQKAFGWSPQTSGGLAKIMNELVKR